MNELIRLLAETTLCSGVLLGFYARLLDRRIGFAAARAALLALPPISVAIPLLRIPVWPAAATPQAIVATLSTVAAPEAAAARGSAIVETIVGSVYLAGVLLLAVAIGRQLAAIGRLRRGATTQLSGGIRLIRTPQRIAAFSFFSTICLWEGTPDDEAAAIIAHEASHIRHRHSAERLAMELMKALLWWNPFVWAAARRLSEVEEYEADRDVLRGGYDRQRYMKLLYRQLVGEMPGIASGLRSSLTRKRFEMMLADAPQRYARLRLAATLPVLAGLLCAFSFTTRAAATTVTTVTTKAANAIAVAATAGEEPMLVVGQMPAFGDSNGGLGAFRRWMQATVSYPDRAFRQRIEGRVVASFVIDREGAVGDIDIIASPDASLSDEVTRVLALSPRWRPGQQRGQRVPVKYILPIEFSLADSEAH